MLEIGLRNAGFAVIPIPLLAGGLAGPGVWRTMSALYLAAMLGHIVVQRKRGYLTMLSHGSELRAVLIAIPVISGMTSGVNAIGLGGRHTFSLYITSLILGLAFAGLLFLSVARRMSVGEDDVLATPMTLLAFRSTIRLTSSPLTRARTADDRLRHDCRTDTIPNPRHYRYYDLVMAGFVTVLLCSNLIGPGKTCILFGLTFGAGNLFFPISYIFGDVLTEVYGYARTRKVIWAGFIVDDLRDRDGARRDPHAGGSERAVQRRDAAGARGRVREYVADRASRR